jgi:hypothetical protein
LTAGFNLFGGTNTVTAGPGPLALAGSIFRDLQTVTQTNPGIAINGDPVGGTAAVLSTAGTQQGISSTGLTAAFNPPKAPKGPGASAQHPGLNASFNPPKAPKATSPGGSGASAEHPGNPGPSNKKGSDPSGSKKDGNGPDGSKKNKH